MLINNVVAKRKFYHYLALFALSGTMFIPSGWPVVHVITVFVFGLLALLLVRGKKTVIGSNFVMGAALTVTVGFFVSFYSVLIDYSNVYFNGIRVFVFSVLIYALIVFVIKNLKSGSWILVDAVYLSSALFSVVALAFIASKVFGFEFVFGFFPFKYRFGMTESGFFAYSMDNLRVLFFTVPFMLAHQMYGKEHDDVYWGQRLILFFSLIAGLLSFRLAFYMSLMLAVFFLFVFFSRQRTRVKWVVYGLSLIVGLGVVLSLYLPAEFVDTFSRVKLSAILDGTDPRYLQHQEWVRLISVSPMFGHGVGSVAGGAVVNDYGYELTYHMLAAQLGLLPVGLIVLLILILFARLVGASFFARNIEIKRNATAMMLGLAGFLVASATNGYLLTFGSLWVIFFPVAFLQWAKLKAKVPPFQTTGAQALGGGLSD